MTRATIRRNIRNDPERLERFSDNELENTRDIFFMKKFYNGHDLELLSAFEACYARGKQASEKIRVLTRQRRSSLENNYAYFLTAYDENLKGLEVCYQSIHDNALRLILSIIMGDYALLVPLQHRAFRRL